MGGLRGTIQFVLRADDGDPLITFRQRHPGELGDAMVIEIHEAVTAPHRVLLTVSPEAVEDLHNLTKGILEGRRPVVDAAIKCGFEWHYNGLAFSCGLEDGHPSPLAFSSGGLFHVSSEGQPYEEPPF